MTRLTRTSAHLNYGTQQSQVTKGSERIYNQNTNSIHRSFATPMCILDLGALHPVLEFSGAGTAERRPASTDNFFQKHTAC